MAKNKIELQIVTRGTYLSVQNDMFLLKIPDTEQGDIRISTNQVHTISLHQDTKISTNALLLALENDITVVLQQASGKQLGSMISARAGSISTIRKKQALFSASSEVVEWIRDLVIEKINKQLSILYHLLYTQENQKKIIEKAIQKLQHYTSIIKETTLLSIDKLRGYEGIVAKNYWEVIACCVPANYYFERRSQHPAYDMFNCLLNYGYGMLYQQIEIALHKAGLDVCLGFFHTDEYNTPTLVFDMIEKYRFWVDYVAIELCKQEQIYPEYFDIHDTGAYYLNKQGKHIWIGMVKDFMAETIEYTPQNRHISRNEHIQQDAYALANYLRNW